MLIQFNINSIFALTDVANNGKQPMNASLSEDSVAETALAKKNSDGKCWMLYFFLWSTPTHQLNVVDGEKNYKMKFYDIMKFYANPNLIP